MNDSGLELVRALGSMDADQREDAFRRCCSSEAWVAAMTSGWPFQTDAQIAGAAADAWWALDESDWLEAFSGHPRIGDRDLSDEWSAAEQAGAEEASPETLAALAAENVDYEEKFGHVFLICATGLAADQMLGSLRRRMGNDPGVELQIAAAEQAKILQLRLERLAGEPGGAQPEPRELQMAQKDDMDTPTGLSTHVLDTTTGRPAAGVAVELARGVDGDWAFLASATTDADGRIASFGESGESVGSGASGSGPGLSDGDYRLRFSTGRYFGATGVPAFHPFVDVVFTVSGDGRHLHVPLLLSPFGYTTYRGS